MLPLRFGLVSAASWRGRHSRLAGGVFGLIYLGATGAVIDLFFGDARYGVVVR